MKFPFLFLATLFILTIFLGFASAVQIETHANYLKGENFVSKVSGDFYTPLSKSNIYFYRDSVETSFGVYSLEKIEGDYYIYFTIPTEKLPGNYSLEIKGTKYYSGNQLMEKNFSKKFEIKNKTAFAIISPALSRPSDYYSNLSVQNLLDKKIDVEYGVEGTTTKNVSLNDGEIKKVEIKTFGGNKFENVSFSYGNETLFAVVYSNLTSIPIENPTSSDNSTNNETNSTDNSSDSWSFWDLFGGSSDKNKTNNGTRNKSQSKNGTPNQDPEVLQTCSEMNLPVCSANEECDTGNYINGQDAQCCNGTCVAPEKGSSAWEIIGWILIGAVVLFLSWFFFFKFKKAKRTPKKLLK